VKAFRFHSDARAELEAAVDWYQARYAPAAEALLDAVEDAIATIRRLPLAWPAWPGRDDVRVKVLIYRFSIVYMVREDEVVILAIAHHRRRPGYWLGRSRSAP
jgi:plasmid stabilization system protein ParE